MSLMTVGSFAALAFLSVFTVPPAKRFSLFAVSAVLFGVARTLFLVFESLPVIVACAITFGAAVAVLNSFIATTVQTIVPRQMRGKVFAFLTAGTGGLVPLGIAVGGILAEFFSIRSIVFVTGLIAAVSFTPLLLNGEVRHAIALEPKDEPDTVDPPPRSLDRPKG